MRNVAAEFSRPLNDSLNLLVKNLTRIIWDAGKNLGTGLPRHVDDIAEERSGTPGARGWKNGRCASVKEIGDLTGRKSRGRERE